MSKPVTPVSMIFFPVHPETVSSSGEKDPSLFSFCGFFFLFTDVLERRAVLMSVDEVPSLFPPHGSSLSC